MRARLLPDIREKIDTPEKKKEYNLQHFTEASSRYDIATRAMSLFRDPAWKRKLVSALPEMTSPICVDLACGTGDITFLLAEKYPHGRIEGLDITESMLDVARERNSHSNVRFTRIDMSRTEFPGGSVDIVTGSYAIRNMPDLKGGIKEINRILRPGGVAGILDFSKSPSPALQAFQWRLLKGWCGLWGLLLHGKPEIHGYIGESLKEYPDRRGLHDLFRRSGFEPLFSRRFLLGIMELIIIRKNEISP